MKSNRKDNKKIHESWIGKIIYGFLMFIPLLAIGITCLYVVFNDNAHESYYGETINQETVLQPTEYKTNIEYTINIGNQIPINLVSSSWIYIDEIDFISGSNTTSLSPLIQNEELYYRFRYTYNTSNINLQFQKEDSQNSSDYYSIITGHNATPFYYSISFRFRVLENVSNVEPLIPFSTYIEYNKYSYLNNAFTYSLEEISNSKYLNWTQNSIIYTGISATTQSLNIEEPFIPMLLTYWLIISILYFLYDIILIIFHVLHRKIHELEESI